MHSFAWYDTSSCRGVSTAYSRSSKYDHPSCRISASFILPLPFPIRPPSRTSFTPLRLPLHARDDTAAIVLLCQHKLIWLPFAACSIQWRIYRKASMEENVAPYIHGYIASSIPCPLVTKGCVKFLFIRWRTHTPKYENVEFHVPSGSWSVIAVAPFYHILNFGNTVP